MTPDDLARVGLRVKLLEWRLHADGWQYADRYRVIFNGFVWVRTQTDAAKGDLIRHDTEADAKAAAQADFEARILAALTPAPVAQDVAGLIAKARHDLDTGAVHFGETINYPPDLIDGVLGDIEEALAALRAHSAPDPVAEAARVLLADAGPVGSMMRKIVFLAGIASEDFPDRSALPIIQNASPTMGEARALRALALKGPTP